MGHASLSLSRRAELALRARSRRNSSGCGNWLVPRRAEACRGRYEWPRHRGELRSLDKLKHVPQRSARKLSAVSFQPLSGMKIVAACREYGGTVIQKGQVPGGELRSLGQAVEQKTGDRLARLGPRSPVGTRNYCNMQLSYCNPRLLSRGKIWVPFSPWIPSPTPPPASS